MFRRRTSTLARLTISCAIVAAALVGSTASAQGETPFEPTQTVVAGSPVDASGAIVVSQGQSVTLTAVVTTTTDGRQVDSGTVWFEEYSPLGPAVQIVDGEATFVTDQLVAGHHQIHARYQGDETMGPSTSAPLSVDVVNGPSKTELKTTRPYTTPTDDINFDVVVTGEPRALAPTGSVTLYDGDQAIATVPLRSWFWGQAHATYTTYKPALIPGPHRFTAVYSGDQWFAPSASPVLVHWVFVVNPSV